MDVATTIEITGIDFDYAYLPAAGAVSGTLVAWLRDLWSAGPPTVRYFSVTVRLTPLDVLGDPWWLTNVYGPTVGAMKGDFLLEIRDICAASPGP
jgi:hypothetical protein